MPETGAMWQQIRDDLAAGILDGRWPIGSRIPSYSQLKEQYGASVATVQRAVKALRDAGILRGEAGVRVVVVREPSPTELGRDSGKTVEQRVAQLEATTTSLGRTSVNHDDRLGVIEATLLEVLGHLGLPRPGEAPSKNRKATGQGDATGHGHSDRSTGAAGA